MRRLLSAPHWKRVPRRRRPLNQLPTKPVRQHPILSLSQSMIIPNTPRAVVSFPRSRSPVTASRLLRNLINWARNSASESRRGENGIKRALIHACGEESMKIRKQVAVAGIRRDCAYGANVITVVNRTAARLSAWRIRLDIVANVTAGAASLRPTRRGVTTRAKLGDLMLLRRPLLLCVN